MDPQNLAIRRVSQRLDPPIHLPHSTRPAIGSEVKGSFFVGHLRGGQMLFTPAYGSHFRMGIDD